MPGDDPARGEPSTAAERVADAERRLEAIDDELARVSG
jgi:hypothetical protein